MNTPKCILFDATLLLTIALCKLFGSVCSETDVKFENAKILQESTADLNKLQNASSNELIQKNITHSSSVVLSIYYIASSPADKCSAENGNDTTEAGTVYCNLVWDGYLCWRRAPARSIVRQRCPNITAAKPDELAERICDSSGKWMGDPESLHAANSNGWTNFTSCFDEEAWDIHKKCSVGGNCHAKYEIAKRTRILETVGFILSFFTLLISLLIFCNFQSLRNLRTKIHINLFIAMEVQVIIRLVIYFDQKITRQQVLISAFERTPFVCISLYFLLEYAKTAMFMWMLIEGVYLHSGIMWINGTRKFPYFAYTIIGWGAPLIMTAIWEYFTIKYLKDAKCAINYNLIPYYHILEGPRHAIILLNLVFLLNIIRVLVVKLRQSHSSDVDQVRKAVRAAFVLLPLLGTANVLFYFQPTDKSVVIFAIWSYTAHFLRSFQGFFIAVIYCFMNGEVRAALARGFRVYMSLDNRTNWFQRRSSMFSGTCNTVTETTTTASRATNNSGNQTGHSTKLTHCDNSQESKNVSSRQRWLFSLCYRNQTAEGRQTSAAPESIVFELSEH